jgi:hypothetical protein
MRGLHMTRYPLMQDLETEYAVSPNTPLLSTEVQENVWVCGEFASLCRSSMMLIHPDRCSHVVWPGLPRA